MLNEYFMNQTIIVQHYLFGLRRDPKKGQMFTHSPNFCAMLRAYQEAMCFRFTQHSELSTSNGLGSSSLLCCCCGTPPVPQQQQQRLAGYDQC
jgi:hypothetical protein